MPAVAHKPVGSPVWIELSSTDPVESVKFYHAAIGLDSSEPYADFAGYRDLKRHDATVAGLMTARPGAASQWVVYLLTHDIESTLAQVEPNGGTVLRAAEDTGDLGRFAYLQDPSGARVGVWQPDNFNGIQVEGDPGTPCWYELHAATAFHETIAFYENVLRWTTTVLGDTPQFRMVTFGQGRDAVAGIFDAKFATESAWKVYFAVVDADATAVDVRAAGGTVLDGPTDTPFGRMSHATDSTGAAFAFITLP